MSEKQNTISEIQELVEAYKEVKAESDRQDAHLQQTMNKMLEQEAKANQKCQELQVQYQTLLSEIRKILHYNHHQEA